VSTLATALLLAVPAALPLEPAPAAPAPSRSAPADDLDHGAVAHAWLETRGREASSAIPIDQLLDEEFVRLRLGAFDVRLPAEALAEQPELIVEAIGAVVDAQVQWLEWFPELGDEGGASEDLERLASWARSLRKATLKKVDASAGTDLLAALEPDAEVTRAAASLADYFANGGPLGLSTAIAPTKLVLLPTRADFVPFVAVVGLFDEPWRHVYWSQDIVNWSHCEYGGRRLIALEYASPGAGARYEQSISIKSRNPDALPQHVAQLAIRTLLETTFDERMEPMLAAALANNLVIERYGEVDTRNDGDTNARSVSARSVFVAGGNPGGGILPPADAESRWRKDKGASHFLPELRLAQKAAGKGLRNRSEKTLVFELEGEQGDEHVVRAPFLGASGSGLPPQDFQADYAEFLRCYRSAFFHWLRERAAGDDKDSRAAFATFLRELATSRSEIGAILEQVYGAPLSAETPDEGCLEGRFLRWISKGK